MGIGKFFSIFKRKQQQFIAHGLPAPVFENFQHGFRVTVSADEHKVTEKVTEKVGEKVGEKLSANQEKILLLMEENTWVTAKTISETIGISKRKTEENISKLKALKKIKRVGSARSGYWENVKHDA